MIENISSLNETGQHGLDIIVILKNAVPFAAYLGALGTLANALLAYKHYIKNKPIINVDFDNRGFELNKEKGTIEVYISCMNKGDSAITIASFGFYISESEKYITLGSYSFDRYFRCRSGCTRLEPGCNISAWIETKDIEECLRAENISLNTKLFFFVRDGHENVYVCTTPFYIPRIPDRVT